ncbi:hypothetical protein SFRURICE_010797 [Spodoptera frugiperda]|nr:hypothetical protein SFRURICE_010797 [Spodoptera frugiperda]
MEESWSSGGAPLLRTRSLPLVLEAASGAAPTRQAKLDPRQLLTLTRHYYPEGGWGWGVAAAATLAQILAHGLHQASAVLAVETVKRFGPETRMQADSAEEIVKNILLAEMGADRQQLGNVKQRQN